MMMQNKAVRPLLDRILSLEPDGKKAYLSENDQIIYNYGFSVARELSAQAVSGTDELIEVMYAALADAPQTEATEEALRAFGMWLAEKL